MQTHISAEPEKKAGEYIQTLLKAHAHMPVLFLVSGGSALTVLDTINIGETGARIALAVLDERFTAKAAARNRDTLMCSVFYTNTIKQGGILLTPEQAEGESHQAYTERLSAHLEEYIQTHNKLFTIGLFGIGEDGHTASIFPTTEQLFNDAYRKDSIYTAVTEAKLSEPHRISITPTFIEEKIDEVILYAVGSTKCDNILSYMHTKSFGVHEIPALIPAQHPRSVLFTDCEALV